MAGRTQAVIPGVKGHVRVETRKGRRYTSIEIDLLPLDADLSDEAVIAFDVLLGSFVKRWAAVAADGSTVYTRPRANVCWAVGKDWIWISKAPGDMADLVVEQLLAILRKPGAFEWPG